MSGPRPGEIHKERLLCVDCLEFKDYSEFYKSQRKWTLPSRQCIVCRDASTWGPQPPAPEVTEQPLPQKEPFAGYGGILLWVDTGGNVVNDAGIRCDVFGRPTKARGKPGRAATERYRARFAPGGACGGLV